MKLNEFTSITTPRILLVPYSAHHVPTYHTWMQDEAIQKATASDPLTLDEEYAMQRSWRDDADKLTFIVCVRGNAGEEEEEEEEEEECDGVVPGLQDAPGCMVGDVNLFLFDDDEDEDDNEEEGEDDGNGREERSVLGELEIMIARPEYQGQGLAQETLRAFMSYIQAELESVLSEYAGTTTGMEREKQAVLKYLRVKIDKDNARSLKLFERMGFVRTSAEPNYFGEVELRTPVLEGRLRDVEARVGLEGFGRVVRYGAEGGRG